MIRLIVGLGNPGSEYYDTRHNVGGWVVEQLCENAQVNLRLERKFHGRCGQLLINSSVKPYILIPISFMNDSGRAVKAVAQYYKISLSEILVIHDELDFIPGTVRLKYGGGPGGHNGLKDIIRMCGDVHFWRLRIGIGHPGHREDVSRYVLTAPRQSEYVQIQLAIQKALSVLPDFCLKESERVIQRLHSE